MDLRLFFYAAGQIMGLFTPCFHVATLVAAVVIPRSVSQGPEALTVKAGSHAYLSCVSPNHAPPSMVQWTKQNLSGGCLYFFRDGRALDSFQHSSFHHRVKLSDPDMRDGDVSLILNNVSVKDTGTYECQCIESSLGRNKRGEPEVVKVISLRVEDSDPEPEVNPDKGEKAANGRGRFRLIISLSVCDTDINTSLLLYSRTSELQSDAGMK